MKHKAAFSSTSEEWATPQEFFDRWNNQYGFTLDVAATHDNAKVATYFTKDDDALSQEWRGTVWCNPPYGRGVGEWVKKAYKSAKEGATVVMLLPVRTDTKWWHDWAVKASEIHFIKGRIKFGGSKNNAPFPSVVLVFKSSREVVGG